jgi:hypothetical protein
MACPRLEGDGDLFNDAYRVETRLQPLPHAGATVHLDRYAVVIPLGAGDPWGLFPDQVFLTRERPIWPGWRSRCVTGPSTV